MNSAESNGFMPRARTEDLHVQELDGEVLVYDRRADTAHCLPEQIARVWRACDDTATRADVASELAMSSEQLEAVLSELDSKALLDVRVAGLSRRSFVVRAAAGAAAAPVILSVLAPTAQAAVSCVNQGGKASGLGCNDNKECCSNSCVPDGGNGNAHHCA